MPLWTEITPTSRPGSDQNPSLLDYGKEAAASAADLAAIPFSSEQYAAEQAGNKAASDQGRGVSDILHGASQYLRADQTPAGQDVAAHPDDHFWASMGYGAANLAPVAAAFAAAPEGAAVEALGGAALQTGSLIDHVMSTTNGMTDDQLAQASPVFKGYLDQGQSSDQARAQLHSDMLSSPDMAMSILTGALAGGVGGRLIRGAGASAFGDGLVQQALTGGAESAASGAAFVGQGEYAAQHAEQEAGMRQDIDYGSIERDALSSGAAFGAFGAAVGGAHGLLSRRVPNVEPVSEAGPDLAQRDALQPEAPSVAPTAPPPPSVPPVPASEPGPWSPRAPVNPDRATGATVTAPTPNDPLGTVPETRATLKAQADQLANGNRAAVLYPPGVIPEPVPPGMKQMFLADGIIQYNPNLTDKPTLAAASKNNTLGEVLGLGPVNKEEAVARQAAGETPTAVVERAPDGTELRAAAGTTETAPGQLQAVQNAASPDSTVSIEPPEAVLSARKNGQVPAQAEGTAFKGATPVAPEVPKPTPHDVAAKDVAMPTPEQAVSGDYSKGKAKWQGIDTTIETPKGGTRLAHDGSWSAPNQPAHYGYFDGTKGKDGDEVDMYMGPNPKSKMVYVIDQIDPDTRAFDEHKAMVGFSSLHEAREAYVNSFSDGKGNARVGAVSAVNAHQFKKWLKEGDTSVPMRYKGKPIEIGERRVLEDQTVTREPITRAETRTGAHESKAKVAQREADAAAIRDAIASHVPEGLPQKVWSTPEARKEIMDRLEATLDEMRAKGVDFGSKVGYENRPGEFVYGAEAKRVLEEVRKRLNVSAESNAGKELFDELTRFLINEQHARQGDFGPLREARKQFGEDYGASKRKGATVDVEHVAAAEPEPGEEKLLTEQEGQSENIPDAERGAEESPALDTERSAEDRAIESEEAPPGSFDDLTSASAGKYTSPDEAFAAGKDRPAVEVGEDAVTRGINAAGSGTPVEIRKKRAINKIVEARAEGAPKKAGTLSIGKREVEAKLGTTTRLHGKLDPNKIGKLPYSGSVLENIHWTSHLDSQPIKDITPDFGKEPTPGSAADFLRKVGNRVWEKVITQAGDIDVHIIKDDVLQSIGRATGATGHIGGYYDPVANEIVMSEKAIRANGLQAHTLIHEGLHAAFQHTLETSPDFQRVIRNLMDQTELYAGDQLRAIGQDYGLGNEHEFLSEAMSNPTFQRILMEVPAPEELLEGIGAKQPMSLWQAMVAGARKFVVRLLGRTDAVDSVLSGMMRVTGALDERTFQDKIADPTKGLIRPVSQMPRMIAAVKVVKDAGAVANENFVDQSKYITKSVMRTLRESVQPANIVRGVWKTLSSDQMRQQYGHYFPDTLFRDFNEVNNKAEVDVQHFAKPGNDLVRETARLQNADPKNFEKYAVLSNEARVLAVHPDKPLSDPANAHLADIEHLAGAENYARMKSEYDALPDSFKSLWGKTVDLYDERHALYGSKLLDREFEGHENMPGLDALKQRILSGTDTPYDRAALEAEFDNAERPEAILGNPTYRPAVGPYFPLARRGDFVVQARHNISEPFGGQRVGTQHKYEFTDLQHAKDFARNLPVHSTTEDRFLDPETGRVLNAEEAKDVVKYPQGVDHRYRVSYDPKYTDFRDSQHEAQRLVDQLRSDPRFSGVLGVRRKDTFDLGELTTQHIDALYKRLSQRMSAAGKENLRNELESQFIASQRGNRILKHSLTAEKISGASTDMVRNLAEYNTASSRALARVIHEPEIQDILGKMKTFERTKEDSNTLLRSDLIKELENRYHNQYASQAGNGFTSFMNTMMSLSFMKFMMSPAHLLVHMTHPGMISLPVLGARHGFGKTAVALARAYKDMGPLGGLGQGVKGLGRIAKDITAKPTNFVDYFKGKIANVSDAVRLGTMLDALTNNGYIHPEAGMEVQRMDAGRNKVTRGLDRVDGAFRELTNATESINRVAEAITAYRLEFDKTGNHDASVRYAGDVLANTQGLYTRGNTAPIFQNKYARPFLQFKQYPQMIYHLLGRQLYDAFKGATPAERIQAAKGFAGVIGTHVAMAGALGLPLELIKIPVMLAHALGVPGVQGYNNYEEDFEKLAGHTFGGWGGQVLSHGITRGLGPFSVDVHHRLGLNSLLTFGTPDTDKPQDTINYMLNAIGGTPVSMLHDTLGGIQSMMHGDFAKGAEQLLPAKAFGDIIRGAELGLYGKPTTKGQAGAAPIGAIGGVIQALGFKPGSVAAYDEARSAAFNDTQNAKTERTNLISQWSSTTGAARLKAMAAITAYNKTQDPANQITQRSLTQSAKQLGGKTVLGTVETKRNKAQLEDLKNVYNVQ